MVLSAFGQETFVAEAGYVTLPESRRRAQRERLPPTIDDETDSTPTPAPTSPTVVPEG